MTLLQKRDLIEQMANYADLMVRDMREDLAVQTPLVLDSSLVHTAKIARFDEFITNNIIWSII